MARKFTAEEKAAAKAALKDAEGEKAVLEAIAKMAAADRKIAERIHAIVRKAAPQLTPRDPAKDAPAAALAQTASAKAPEAKASALPSKAPGAAAVQAVRPA